MNEIRTCGREGCKPAYIEAQQFIRCLHCGAAGVTGAEDKAIKLWNDEMAVAKGERKPFLP